MILLALGAVSYQYDRMLFWPLMSHTLSFRLSSPTI
jgi:hypothetical protein